MRIKTAIGILTASLLLMGCEKQSYKGYKDIYKLSSKGSNHEKSGPYKLFSENGKYIMESIPFEHVNVIFGDLCSGITKVYDSKNDSLLYSINRYFGLDNTFFSSNGSSIVYVNNFWKGSSYDSCSTSILEFYKAGNLTKEYSYKKLLKSDYGNELSWLFWDSKINKVLANNNHYSIGDSIYLIPEKTGTVIILNINTGEVICEIDITDYLNNLELIQYLPPKVEFIEIEEAEYLPNLINGKTFRDGLKEKMNIELIASNESKKENRYYFYFLIECKIDRFGKPFEIKINSNEQVLVETVDELKKEIKTFIESQRFQADSIPYNLEFWQYEDRFYISRNPKVVATQDLETYKIEVCKKDSFSGFYIPIDILDAHKELDKMLADSAKLKLKNGESSHYGLGRQLRNYWGLWSGGRLKCYFAEMELYHPDNISSLILLTYRMKLNNQQKNLDSLIQAYSKSEKERMEN